MSPPEGPSDDRVLVERAAQGDREAFGLLVRRHQDRVFNVAFQILRNREDALDAAQDAFVKAFASLPGFKGESSFTTWIHRITVNLAIDSLRRRRRVDPAPYDDQRAAPDAVEGGPAASDDPSRALETGQVRALLGRGIAELPPAQRAVLVLREIQGMTYEEISRVVGCSLGTVMSRLFYARRRLAQLLARHHDDLR
jgi:RNA polymerase sigma-70 factor, ECF subfamily